VEAQVLIFDRKVDPFLKAAQEELGGKQRNRGRTMGGTHPLLFLRSTHDVSLTIMYRRNTYLRRTSTTHHASSAASMKRTRFVDSIQNCMDRAVLHRVSMAYQSLHEPELEGEWNSVFGAVGIIMPPLNTHKTS
jgi:hypothetical protein